MQYLCVGAQESLPLVERQAFLLLRLVWTYAIEFLIVNVGMTARLFLLPL